MRATNADTLVELGSGTSEKTRLLLDAMRDAGTLARFVPFDVSKQTLHDAAAAIERDYPGIDVQPVVGDFTLDLDSIPRGGRRLVVFLGGTIGNLLPEPRAHFLEEVAALLGPDDHFLVGTDLVKDVHRLEAAYDDAQGVTAAFNKNVLHVMNRELDADFDVDAFEHVAVFDTEREWIEMRLRSTRRQRVRLGALDLDVEFRAGEEMRTEVSAKFTRHTRRTRAQGGRAHARRLVDRSRPRLRALAGASQLVARRGVRLEDAMDNALNKALVRAILEHAEGYAWTMQDIGLLGLRLDDRREYRLHVWDASYSVGEPPVHDHPFDFTSTVIAGEMTNTRYEEDPSGVEYRRVRYRPPNEDARATDTVRLSGTATTFTAGRQYSQLAHELHDSRQLPGTVTIIRRTFKDVPELTVCTRGEAAWVSGQSRPAAPDDVKRITATALELF